MDATIAFNSDRLGEMNIWLHDVATGADRRLTSGPGGDYQPDVVARRAIAGVLLRPRGQHRHLVGARWRTGGWSG